MSLRVRQAGLLSLLVDHGRPHCRHLGVPLGGAADRGALALGNALVGNSRTRSRSRSRLPGRRWKHFTRPRASSSVPRFSPPINGRAISPGTTFTLEPGDVLRGRRHLTGVRGYLCVAGGFSMSPELLGSRSGLEPLRAGRRVDVPGTRIAGRRFRMQSLRLPPWTRSRFVSSTARSATGSRTMPSSRRTTRSRPRAIAWACGSRADRLSRRAGELVSEAVAPGAVQVTNDGLPVVLGVDGQTIGGYPKIAHVIRADLDLLAQFRPGERGAVRRRSLEEAEKLPANGQQS